MRSFSTEERRRRLGVRHHLAVRSRSLEAVAEDLAGLHSSDPVTVQLSARARVAGFAPADLEESLYERRSLVRILGMRRTLFVVPRALAAVVDAACTKALAPGERRRLERMLAEQGIAEEPARWLDDVCARTLAALEDGEKAAVELTTLVPELGERLRFGEGKSWGGEFGVSTRVLFLLAAEGRVVRARPRGGWTSGQYRWAATERWLGEPLAEIPDDEACASLLGRWLRAFGPATLTDLRWWTGWTVARARATLGAVGAVEVALEGDEPGWALPDDLEATPSPGPWVALLPSLDATVMGWKLRDWYLGPHAAELFDRNGNAGPTVWVDARAVGGWTQAPDGEIRIGLLEEVDRPAARRIERERLALEAWFGDVRITPRFRTPLERRLRDAATPPARSSPARAARPR
ncbi:MAG TPA: winged helix DNA-binding domain-containing protein [Actinomycetota bacterium]